MLKVIIFALFFVSSFFLAGTSAFYDEAASILDNQTWDYLQDLGDVSDATDGSLQRTFLSVASRLAMNKVELWMRRGGMDTWVDEVGNVHGRLEGAIPNQKVLLIGSHIDTERCREVRRNPRSSRWCFQRQGGDSRDGISRPEDSEPRASGRLF